MRVCRHLFGGAAVDRRTTKGCAIGPAQRRDECVALVDASTSQQQQAHRNARKVRPSEGVNCCLHILSQRGEGLVAQRLLIRHAGARQHGERLIE